MTFDRFEFDLERRALLEDGTPVHLSPKAFRLLEILLGNRPRALSKRELNDAIWPETFVEESNLAGLVAELRTALGDRSRPARFVRTVHGFGYAFAGEVSEAATPSIPAVVVFAGKTIPLYAGVNVLGRDPSSGILIDDGTVSRRHASITIDDQRATLEDLGSKNGTFVDGTRLNAPTALDDGTTFVLGDASVLFRRATSAGSTITLCGVRQR
ncbi:MAG TPA: FHA domain-containing protein [Thermoanaerobaculia bacterium]|nr:FHA domain-containing protein [Thermoanaerobaculia bacterium]